MTLTIITGIPRSGKTLLATYFSFFNNRNTVYANYSILQNIKYKSIELNDFIENELSDCLIILDEAYIWLESRLAMSKINRLCSYVLMQSGKHDVDIILTSQLLSMLEMRFRNLMTTLITAEHDEKNKLFIYNIYNNRYHYKKTLKFKEIDMSYYYDKYKTLEIITSDKIKELVLETMPRDKVKKLRDDLVPQILEYFSNYKNISLDDIKFWLYDNNHNVRLAKYIHTKLKYLKHKNE